MKKTIIYLVITIFALIMLNSCKTKRKMIPCPSYVQAEINDNILKFRKN